MTTNQPTDATPQAGELYPCKDWPSCDHQRCEDASYLQQIQAHHAEVDELTTQLATAQALAKALEECANRFKLRMEAIYLGITDSECGDYHLGDVLHEATSALEQDYPQPVDASSLARIARVALVAYKFMHAEKSTNCGIDFWSEFVDAYNAIQPNDIALAQALAGGA